MVLAIPIFGHVYDDKDAGQIAELISNFSFQCQYLLYLLTRLFDLFDDISNIAGNTYRVGELIERMNDNQENDHQKLIKKEQSKIVDQNNSDSENNIDKTRAIVTEVSNQELLDENICFIMDNVSIFLPNKSKTLIKNLNFKLEKDQNVLLTGHTGCGKTSLLRCINGLWNSYSGEILLNKNKDPKFLFFLPQSSYFTTGSLLEQIIYPSLKSDFYQQNAEIQQIQLAEMKYFLKKFNLENLLISVDNDMDSKPSFNWATVLSNGNFQIFYSH